MTVSTRIGHRYSTVNEFPYLIPRSRLPTYANKRIGNARLILICRRIKETVEKLFFHATIPGDAARQAAKVPSADFAAPHLEPRTETDRSPLRRHLQN